MKSIIALFTTFLSAAFAYAQAPQSFNYQAVARDASGNIWATKNISVRITITNGNGGSSLYQESHAVATNQFGLFTLNVGSISPGNFSSINWATANAWIKVEYDP